MTSPHLPGQDESRKDFSIRLLQLSLPIMLQNLLGSSVSFVDTMMIGMINERAIAAIGLASQMFFLILLFFFGVGSGAAIFTAQFWGAKDIKSLHSVMGIALVISLAGALFSSVLSVVFPATIMGVFTKDPVVAAYGVEYLRVVGVSYLFTAVVMVFSTALRSTGDAKTPLYISCISLTMNVVLNYLLILGKFGFPRMGVSGAALATSISRFVEMVVLLFVVYTRKRPVAAPISRLFSLPGPLVKRYIITCLPVVLNEMFWSLGMTTYKIAFSRMGMETIAAVNVTEAIQGLFFVVLMGIGNASAIMIGNRIGEGHLDMARRYANRMLVLGIACGTVLGLFMAVLSPLLPLPFNLSGPVLEMATVALVALGVLIPIKAFNMVLIVGVLRAGGDTRFSMLVEISGVWLIGVPCAFIGAMLLKLPLWAVYLMVGSEELYKMLFGLFRVKSGKWINRLVGSDSDTIA